MKPPRPRVTTAPAPAAKSVKPPSGRVSRKAAAGGVPSRRVVRRIDSWTVFKLSLLFYLCVFAVLLIAGIILWNVAASFGVITHVEKFIRSLFDLTSFKFRGPVVFAAAAGAGLVLVLLGTLANVLVAVVYNLISDVVGGVQVVVVEEAP